MIESTKGSLRILNIELYSKPQLSSIEFYLRTIQTTCPNIEVLPVWLISEISLTDFEILLKSCSKIRKIIIHVITPLSRLFDTVLARPVLYLLAIFYTIFILCSCIIIRLLTYFSFLFLNLLSHQTSAVYVNIDRSMNAHVGS